MASTFVNDLRLEEIGSGEQSGTWGDTTNTNLELIAEAFSFGTEAIPTNVTNSVHTTTIANGATDPGRSIFLRYTGSQNVAVTVTIGPPTVSKLWFIENATSGSSVNLIIKQGSGATVTIPAGQTKAIYSNGAGTGAAMVDAFATLNVVDLLVDDDLTVTDDVAIGGLATVGGTLAVTGIATFTDDIIIGDGKTIGSASDVDAMSISSGGVVNFSARPTFAASLTIQDGGSLGSASDLNAMTISSGGVVAVTATTASSSPTTGALTVGGGLGVAADLFVGDDFDVAGDAVIDLTCLVTGILTTTAGTVFNGGFAANAGSSITRDDNGAQLTLISTDTDASSGPVLDLYRNSGNAIDGDNIGQINFYGENTSDQKHQYLYLFSEINDATADEEDVRFVIGGLVAGADSSIIEYTQGTPATGADPEIVFNNTSRDINFRVESNGNANMLFVDGGNNRIGIGEATPLSTVHIEDDGGAVLTLGNSQSPPDVEANTVFGRINFFAADRSSSTNATGGVARIEALASAGYSNTSPADLLFYTHAASANDGSVLGTPAEALRINSSGDVIIANTGGTLITTTAGSQNLRLGENAGDSILSGGNFNVFAGYNAGTANTIGDENVAIGHAALATNVAGSKSTAIGQGALNAQNKASSAAGDQFNTAVGYHAGVLVSTGIQNTLVGGEAGADLNTGVDNVAVGWRAMFEANSGHSNVAMGVSAMRDSTTGFYNTAVGYAAMYDGVVTGNNNIAMGYLPLQSLTGGIGNTAIGKDALGALTVGNNNVAIGFEAFKASNASEITGVGNFSGNNSTGAGQVFVGHSAGRFVTSGTTQTFVGHNAGKGITGAKLTGSSNTAIGSNAGLLLQGAATSNVFLGKDAGDVTTTGARNICIGQNSNPSAATNTNSIALGHDLAAASNDFTFGKNGASATCDFDADAVFTHSSDLRLKTNIADAVLGLAFVNDLRPVTYKWKAAAALDANDAELAHLRKRDEDGNLINCKNTELTMHGLIAQEVKTALDTAGVSRFKGWSEDQYGVQGISNEMYVIPLIKAVQELSTALDAALARITTLEG